MKYTQEVHTLHMLRALYRDKGITLSNPTNSLEGNLGFVNEVNGEYIFSPIVYSGKSINKSFIKQMTKIHKEIFKCSPKFQEFK